MTCGYSIPSSRYALRGFHGTDYNYEDYVLPPSEHRGHQHFKGLSEASLTYWIPADVDPVEREKNAWTWAYTGWSSDRTGRGRYRVHVTRPIGEQWFDGNLHGNDDPYDDNDWWKWARVCERQVIVDTIWSPPPDTTADQTMVEQTFPKIDWKEYGGEWFIVHGFSRQRAWSVPNKPNAHPHDDDQFYEWEYSRQDDEVVHVKPQPVPEGQLQLDVGEGGYVPYVEPPVVVDLPWNGFTYGEPFLGSSAARQRQKNSTFFQNYGYGQVPDQYEPYFKAMRPGDTLTVSYQKAPVYTERYNRFYRQYQRPLDFDGEWE